MENGKLTDQPLVDVDKRRKNMLQPTGFFNVESVE